MPLVFTESRCLSLFLLATVEQKYVTHEEKSEQGLYPHQSAVTADGCICCRNYDVIAMDNSTGNIFRSTDLCWDTNSLIIFKSDVQIHVFAAGNIPHTKQLKCLTLVFSLLFLSYLFWVCSAVEGADTKPRPHFSNAS